MKWLRALLGYGGPHEGDAIDIHAARTVQSAAVALAESHAAARNLAWRPPIEARLLWHAGRPCWFVRSNAIGRGFSVEVVIEDGTGTVVDERVLPR